MIRNRIVDSLVLNLICNQAESVNVILSNVLEHWDRRLSMLDSLAKFRSVIFQLAITYLKI